MPRLFLMRLDEIQPSQLYISAAKLARVQAEPESQEPIPVKFLDGRTIYTDGHTRALAAHLRGQSAVEVYWDEEELDWEAYRICVAWCQTEGIYTVADLRERVISADDYEVLWHERCRVMQQDLEEKRKFDAAR